MEMLNVVWEFCSLNPDTGEISVSDSNLSYRPSYEIGIEKATLIQKENTLQITGDKIDMHCWFSRLWLTTPKLIDAFDETGIKHGYKNLFDRIKKKKTPYISGWTANKKRLPFFYETTSWKLFKE